MPGAGPTIVRAMLLFLAAPDGTPLRVCDVERGSAHDVYTASLHASPALYPAAAAGLVALAGVGYVGAGIGIRTPRRPRPTFPAR